MKITLFKNNYLIKENQGKKSVTASSIRRKSYESEFLDEDMIHSADGCELDRFIIENMQLKTKEDVSKAIKMLERIKPALNKKGEI